MILVDEWLLSKADATDKDRRHIMGFYYKHRGTAPEFAVAT